MRLLKRGLLSSGMALLLLGAASADDLEGRILTPSDTASNLAGAALTELLMGDGGAEGNVKQVQVLESSERKLVVKVTFDGFRGRDVIVRAANTNGQHQNSVSRSVTRIGESETELTATLELDEGVAEGFELESPLLLIRIKRPGGMVVRERLFALNKTWTQAIAAENIVVAVRPQPIGQTADYVRRLQTAGTQTAVMPQRTVRSVTGDAITKNLGKAVTLSPDATRFRAMREIQLSPTQLRGLEVPRAIETEPKPEPSSTETMRMDVARSSIAQPTIAMRALSESERKTITALSSKASSFNTPSFVYQQAKPKPTPTSTEPTNMLAASAHKPFEMIDKESGIDIDYDKVFGVFEDIFEDSNDASGMFYYAPGHYRLNYDPDIGGAEGLAFRMSYRTLSEDGSGAQDDRAVRIAMTLKSSVDANSVEILRSLLEKYARSRTDLTFRELRPLPVSSPPFLNFDSELRDIVEPDQIDFVELSNFLEEMVVSWTANETNVGIIRQRLVDSGLPFAGRAVFPVPSEGYRETIAVPAEINLSDAGIYETVRFDRDAPLRNESPLPISLKYVHALVLSANGGPRIYSWSLGDAVVPSKAQIEVDFSLFPKALEDSADRVWVEYTVDKTCSDCIEDVLDALVRGGVWPDITSLEVRPIENLLFDDGIVEVWMELRSRFLAPLDRELVTAPMIYLRPGEMPAPVRPFFQADRTDPDTGEEWPLYEFRLSKLLETGELVEGTDWVASSSAIEARLPVGPFQLNQSFASEAAGDE